ncbi:MAG: hypothetical protein HOO93_02870 [Methyloglobulus sp.]|nr:hypothetical protein [Methyloglobulus sp.]
MKTSHIDYVELFEFAAIGYLKVNSEGRVDCINSFGSKLLRMERKEAINGDLCTDSRNCG